MVEKSPPSRRTQHHNYVESLLDEVASGMFDGWDNYYEDKSAYRDLLLGFLDAWELTCRARYDLSTRSKNGHSNGVRIQEGV